MSKIIAIDGPSASGKSTVAGKRPAPGLGLRGFRSGISRADLAFLRRGVDTRDAAAVARALPDVRLEFFWMMAGPCDSASARRC